MAAVLEYSIEQLMPTQEECSKIAKVMLEYEEAKLWPNYDSWSKDKKNWNKTPWGISWNVGKVAYDRKIHKGWKATKTDDKALRLFIISVVLGWKDLTEQMKKALKYWDIEPADVERLAKEVWCKPDNANKIIDMCNKALSSITESSAEIAGQILTETVEKHDSLNSKLFNKDGVLKNKVRNKMLEIVDAFLTDLKDQDIKIKIDDILMIGSNASYNYTKDSDIDLHILANTKAVDYPADLGNALYSAYRSIFNKSLDISIYDIPLEIFVETEDSARVSNGVYSVKKNKWIKKPVAEDIPEYDKEALNKLVGDWEAKCKDLIDDIKADKLNDEKKVVKMLEDIYDKLRKKGVAKGEYSIENLTFKELRNKGYLDQLKDYRNELMSKRLSLEEELDMRAWDKMSDEIARAAYGNKPQFLRDGKTFYIYNLKKDDAETALRRIRALPFIATVSTNDSGKFDYSNIMDIAMNGMPKKYYNISGKIKE